VSGSPNEMSYAYARLPTFVIYARPAIFSEPQVYTWPYVAIDHEVNNYKVIHL
jgi:hypothetical protein